MSLESSNELFFHLKLASKASLRILENVDSFSMSSVFELNLYLCEVLNLELVG